MTLFGGDRDYAGWVRRGKRITAGYATGGGARATGRVIAYTERPTITIVTDDGEYITWIAELCEVIDSPPREIVNVTVVPRAGAVFPAPTIPIAFAVEGGVVEIDTTGTVKHYGQVVVGARCGHSYTAG